MTTNSRVEVRPWGVAGELVAFIPAGHPALKRLRPHADWEATYYHRPDGRRPIAYDLGFGPDALQQAGELGRWLAAALAATG